MSIFEPAIRAKVSINLVWSRLYYFANLLILNYLNIWIVIIKYIYDSIVKFCSFQLESVWCWPIHGWYGNFWRDLSFRFSTVSQDPGRGREHATRSCRLGRRSSGRRLVRSRIRRTTATIKFCEGWPSSFLFFQFSSFMSVAMSRLSPSSCKQRDK